MAQESLGNMYVSGEGVPEDLTEAAKWYRKAAEQSDNSGQLSLGLCHDNGIGVEKSFVEVMNWYQKAASNGDSEAKARIEELRKRGLKG